MMVLGFAGVGDMTYRRSQRRSTRCLIQAQIRDDRGRLRAVFCLAPLTGRLAPADMGRDASSRRAYSITPTFSQRRVTSPGRLSN